jgi:hypothetical protein
LIDYFANKFRSIKPWWAILRRNGESAFRLLLFEAPWRIIKSIYFFPAQVINHHVFFYINRRRLLTFNESFFSGSKPIYYIIVMPFTLFMLIPCLKLVNDGIEIILIFNGAKRWERRVLKQMFPKIEALALTSFPSSSYKHGRVIDLLFSAAHGNFGIMDHDLYFFNNSCMQDVQFTSDQIMAYIFFHTNEKTNLLFPATYFLYFNAIELKQMISKYKLSCLRNKKPPKHLKKKVQSLGFDSHNYPKSWARYFDTCQLVQTLAIYEKRQFKKIDSHENNVIHIGGTTYGVNSLTRLYMNALLLELECNHEVRNTYTRKVLGNKTKQTIAERIISGKTDIPQLLRINKFIKRLDAVLITRDEL